MVKIFSRRATNRTIEIRREHECDETRSFVRCHGVLPRASYLATLITCTKHMGHAETHARARARVQRNPFGLSRILRQVICLPRLECLFYVALTRAHGLELGSANFLASSLRGANLGSASSLPVHPLFSPPFFPFFGNYSALFILDRFSFSETTFPYDNIVLRYLPVRSYIFTRRSSVTRLSRIETLYSMRVIRKIFDAETMYIPSNREVNCFFFFSSDVIALDRVRVHVHVQTRCRRC